MSEKYYQHVKVAYGFCASKRCACPITLGWNPCGLQTPYYLCGDFRKCGAQYALKEVDENGQGRIYLKVAETINKHTKAKGARRNSASGQTLLGGGVGRYKT